LEEGGIKVNSQMLANLPGVYACGNCAETPDPVSGESTLIMLWHNARRQQDSELTGKLRTGGLDDIKSKTSR